MLLLSLAGCWGGWWGAPTQTDRSGMAGTIHAPGGAPLAGLEVNNLESSTVTGADGSFGLHYKRPDLYVHFTHAQVGYWRTYRDEDEGQALQIELPETRKLDLDCGGLTCRLDLKWELGEGLSAKVKQACAGDHHVIHGPAGVPTATCRANGETVADAVRREGDRLVLLGPARSVRVDLDADGEPSLCRVEIGDSHADLVDGSATIEVRGGGWAQVVCDGRAALPVAIEPDATALAVSWSATGPALQPPPGVELEHLRLSRIDAPWHVELDVAEGGTFLLPPLPAGTYQLVLHEGEPVEVPTDLEPRAPDALVGRLLSSGAFVVALVLDQDRLDGVLEPSMKENP